MFKSKKEIKKFSVNNKELKCHMCDNNTFWLKKSLMNTWFFTVMNFDWANREADNYICSECGYVHTFFSK